jgi:hypothetical protein
MRAGDGLRPYASDQFVAAHAQPGYVDLLRRRSLTTCSVSLLQRRGRSIPAAALCHLLRADPPRRPPCGHETGADHERMGNQVVGMDSL